MRVLFLAHRSLARSMRPALRKQGIQVEGTERASRARFKLQSDEYDAALLDHERLDRDGSTRLLEWRREGLKTHVIVLMPAGCGSGDRASALDAGADACLLPPLSVEELCAHLRAFKRRDEMVVRPIRQIHDLAIDLAARTVRRGDRAIHLTPREFDLLQLLAAHPGRVVSRSMILEHLYERASDRSNVVDVYISYLRNKIDRGFDFPLILTRWGQGYLLRAPEVRNQSA